MNKIDPGGNSWLDRAWDTVFGEGSFNKAFGDNGSRLSDAKLGNNYEKAYARYDSAASPKNSPDMPPQSYADRKKSFYDMATIATGQAGNADEIFDILALGAGAVRYAGKKLLFGSVDDVAKVVSSNALGAAGEAAVRSAYNIGPKKAEIMFGKLRYPDGILPTVMSEVKNVAKLSYTRQISDYTQFALSTGRQFHLYVRPSTVLSGPLLGAINAGIIIRRYIP